MPPHSTISVRHPNTTNTVGGSLDMLYRIFREQRCHGLGPSSATLPERRADDFVEPAMIGGE